MKCEFLIAFLFATGIVTFGNSKLLHAEKLPSLLLTPSVAIQKASQQKQSSAQPTLKKTVVRQRQMVVNFSIFPKPAGKKIFDPEAGSTTAGDQVVTPVTNMELELFDGELYELSIDEVRDESPDGSTVTMVGHLLGVDGSQVILVSDGAILSGNITIPGRNMFQIRYIGNNIHAIREIDQHAFPPEKHALEIPTQPGTAPPQTNIIPDSPAGSSPDSTAGDALPVAGDESGSILDVMVVYTPVARTAAGGTAAMNTLIDLAVSESNQGYSNSGLYQRINLVHREEVSYTEGPDGSNDAFTVALTDITGTSDGEMDNVHSLRNDYGADMVSLFIDDPAWCGLAWVMYTESHDSQDHAFSVVRYDCATGYYSFAHEMGHNQGGMHDRYTSSGDGVFSYSHGYQDPERSFRTVMAYDCPDGGCPRVNYWSNPDIDYINDAGSNRGPMGIEYTAANSADMRRSHNYTRDTVANWRPRYVYVDQAASGTETGLSSNPFNTVSEGVALIGKYATGARLYITPGIYSGSGNYPLTITKPVSIMANGTGTVTFAP